MAVTTTTIQNDANWLVTQTVATNDATGAVIWTSETATPQPGTPAANQQTLQQKAATALANNTTFLGIASPTNAQVLAQTQALTRQVNALIRLVAQLLDSTTGT